VEAPTPEIVAVGERDAWPYLVMTRVKGRLGSEVWPRLADDQKTSLLHQIGRTIARRSSHNGQFSSKDRSTSVAPGTSAPAWSPSEVF
jgi:hypothetical protein